jgi:hypothetical protein
MNRPRHHVREVPEPRLIAAHFLVSLKCGSMAGLRVGIGGHRITDTTKCDQARIRSSMNGANLWRHHVLDLDEAG